MSDNPMFLYAGDYESVDDAKADLEALKELHREHLVGTFDAAVVTRKKTAGERCGASAATGGWNRHRNQQRERRAR